MPPQRYNSQTTIQPGPVYRPPATPMPSMPAAPQFAFPVFPSPGAGYFQQANQLEKVGSMAMTWFDLLATRHDQDAARQAREDAPALIKYDGNGMLIPVQSFTPEGFNTRAYRQSYEDTAKALYMQSAATEFTNHVNVVTKAHPTDIGAVQAAIAEKKTAMMQNLDASMSKLLALRFNAIEGQALSQTNGNIKSEQLAVAGTQATNALGAFVTDAAKSQVLVDKMQPQDLVVNDKLLATRWSEFETLARGAGWSDARIKQAFEDSRVKIYVARHENDIRRMTFDAGGGTSAAAGQIFNQLKSQHSLKPHLAAAIVGGLFGESNQFDPATVHDNGTGLGIAGWRLERRDAMVKEAQKQGVSPTDRDFQIKYFLEELNKRPEGKRFFAAKDTTEAVTALMDFFRPKGWTPEAPQNGAGFGVRVGFANSVLGSGGEQGQLDIARVAQVDQQIEQIAEAAGPYAAQVRQALQAAKSAAVSQSQTRVAAFNQAETNKIQAQQVEYLKALQTAPEGDVEIRNAIRRDISATLLDSSLSDAGKLKAVAMYQSVDAMTAQQAAPFYQQQVTRLVNTMQDVSQPAERQRAAVDQLSEIVKDPSLSTYLPVGTRNYAETAIRQAHRTVVAGDVAGFQAQAAAGVLPPEVIADRTANLISRGVIGDTPAAVMSMAQARQLYDSGVKAWTEQATSRELASQGLERWRTSRNMPTKDEETAIQKAYPFKAPGGGALNLGDAAHVQQLENYVALTGTMPAAAKDQLANVPMGADPERTAQLHGAFKRVATVIRNKPGMDPENVYPYLANLIGAKPTAFLADVGRVGYENAVKFAQAEPNAVGRQQGESAAASLKAVDTAIDKFVGEMPAQARQDFFSWVPWNKAADDTTKLSQEILRGAGKGQGIMEWVDPTDGMLSNQVTTLKISPALRSMVSQHADNNLRVNGRALSRLGEEGAQAYAVRQAMQAYRDLIDVVPSEDGKSAVLGLKSWEKQSAELLKLPGHAAPKVAYGLLQGIVQAGNKGGQIYDPGSLQSKLHVTDYGERFWSVTGTQNGVPVELERMALDDPRIGKLAGTINEEASRYMRKHWTGKAGAKEGMTPEEQAWLGSSAATLAINTMKGIGLIGGDIIRTDVKERMAGEWADPSWFDKMLDRIGLLSRRAPVGSTDWKATIEKARKGVTKEDRQRFDRLEALTMPFDDLATPMSP